MSGIFDDEGIRFAYPPDWEVQVEPDGSRTTITLNAPDGVAFALVSIDDDCPEPDAIADEALEAMRQEYPGLDAVATEDTIDGHLAVGHDLEFMTLDATNACSIRCFRTPRRTVLIFGQWSDLEGDEPAEQVETLRRSLIETDLD